MNVISFFVGTDPQLFNITNSPSSQNYFKKWLVNKLQAIGVCVSKSDLLVNGQTFKAFITITSSDSHISAEIKVELRKNIIFDLDVCPDCSTRGLIFGKSKSADKFASDIANKINEAFSHDDDILVFWPHGPRPRDYLRGYRIGDALVELYGASINYSRGDKSACDAAINNIMHCGVDAVPHLINEIICEGICSFPEYIMQIALSLGKIRDPRSVNILIFLLFNEDAVWFLRSQAAWSLGQIGSKKVVEPLIFIFRTLKKGFTDNKYLYNGLHCGAMRLEIITALGEIDDKIATKAIKESADDPDFMVAGAAQCILDAKQKLDYKTASYNSDTCTDQLEQKSEYKNQMMERLSAWQNKND